MKKSIFAIFPLVLMLTGCPFFCQFGDEIEIENVDLSITPIVIPKDDVYTYVLEENINLNLTFKPDFEKFEKYRIILSIRKNTENFYERERVYDDYFIVEKENEIVNYENPFYFNEADYAEAEEIIQNYTITPKKTGKFEINVYLEGYTKDLKDINKYTNNWCYIWNIREP